MTRHRTPQTLRRIPLWRAYERQVLADLTSRFEGVADVTYDERGRQRLPGRYSGTARQVDVLIRGQLNDEVDFGLMVVECKLLTRRVTVKDVEAFAGMLEGVGADVGLMITAKGFAEPAKRRASGVKGMTLEVLALDELAKWLRLSPIIAWTSGASTGRLPTTTMKGRYTPAPNR